MIEWEFFFKRYPEIGDRPKKGTIEPLKRFYQNPKGSIEPPFGPQIASIEPL